MQIVDSTLAIEPGEPQNHLAIILPTYSKKLRGITNAISQGIVKEKKQDMDLWLPLVFYELEDGTISTLTRTYEQAISNGANIVIGPLTRNGVSSLVQQKLNFVPTICLNSISHFPQIDKNIYLFGLNIEHETETLARMAFSEGGRKVLTIYEDSPIQKRISYAMQKEWLKLTGEAITPLNFEDYKNDLNGLSAYLENTEADTIFMAVSAKTAQNLRPYLGTRLPIYATSLIHTSHTDKLRMHDLEDVKFMEMPWVISHTSSFTMLDGLGKSLQLERFFALGMDSYKIAKGILNTEINLPLSLSGVSGDIILNYPFFLRAGSPVVFAKGRVKPLIINNSK